jgi:hypothetical protein
MTLTDGEIVLYHGDRRRVIWAEGRIHTVVIEGSGRVIKPGRNPIREEAVVVPINTIQKLKGEGRT